jgi:hypothetical protein
VPYGRGPFWVPLHRAAGGWAQPWRPPRPLRSRPPVDAYTRRVQAELDVSGAVKLNSQGAGFVTLAPDGMTAWQCEHVQVGTTTGPTDQSNVIFYRTAVVPHRILGQTAQGGGDTLSFHAALRPGDTFIAVWSGGNPGDVATVNLIGIVHALVAG